MSYSPGSTGQRSLRGPPLEIGSRFKAIKVQNTIWNQHHVDGYVVQRVPDVVIHSFNSHFLSANSVPGTVVGLGYNSKKPNRQKSLELTYILDR